MSEGRLSSSPQQRISHPGPRRSGGRRARIWGGDSGQTLAFSAVLMTCLVAILGLALDAGILLRAKRIAQTAADAGAVSGAAEIRYGGVTAAAKAATAQNGVTDGSNGSTVTVNNPPLAGPHKNNSGYVEVIASLKAPTLFMQLFNQNAVNVTARAVAGLRASHGCIYAMDPTSTKSFWVTGSGTMSLPNCSIFIDSSDSQSIYKTGSSTITAAWIGDVGGYYISAGSITPTPVTGIAPVADPLAYLQPPTIPPTCTGVINITGSGTGQTINVNQGCYTKINISGSQSVSFGPGTYIVNGSGVGILSITGSGTISGSSVTFYVTGGGSASITGSGSLNLSAPTTGTYNGVLFFQDRSDTSQVSITGSTGDGLNGIIYCPAAQLSFTGSGSPSLFATVVAGKYKGTGTVTMKDYALVNSGTPLQGSALAE